MIGNLQPIVIDNGSFMIKSGFSYDEYPTSVFLNIGGFDIGAGRNLDYLRCIGDEAESNKETLHLEYPIKNGLINNWDLMERVWHYTIYDKLRAIPEDHPVFLTERLFTPKREREKLAQVMFETFQVPAFYASTDAPLSLHSVGRCTGLVLNSGHGFTSCVPIFDGYVQKGRIKSINISGDEITDYLMHLFDRKDFHFSTTAEKEMVRDIKENLCYIAFDYFEESAKLRTGFNIEKYIELPDKKTLIMESERFTAPECLFQPSLIGLDCEGVDEMMDKCIRSCHHDLQREFYRNILLSGGSTMYPGFSERLTEELKRRVHITMKVNVIAPAERKYSAWIGGKVLCSVLRGNDWISRADYEESGPEIVNKIFS